MSAHTFVMQLPSGRKVWRGDEVGCASAELLYADAAVNGMIAATRASSSDIFWITAEEADRYLAKAEGRA
jgi:hypothetical protein